jgi:uncharacterized protein
LTHPAKLFGIGVPRRLSFLAIALFVALVQRATANNTAQTLPFSQDWSNTGLITVNILEAPTPTSWPDVPGIIGFRGDGMTAAIDVNPQTLTQEDLTPVVNVIANQTSVLNPTGGVAEFELTNPVVALQGSGTADAPYLLIHLNTTGRSNIQVSYNVRDIDSTLDDAAQQVALHYRVGGSGPFTNVAAAYIADATTGPSLANQVTAVSVILPPAVDNQPLVQLRIMTTNATGNDEWVGIDDIVVRESLVQTVPTGSGLATPSTVSAGDETLLTVAVTPGSNPTSTGLTVRADLSSIGGLASQPFFDDGVTGGDETAGDNIFAFLAAVPVATVPGPRLLPVTISDAELRMGLASIALTVEPPPLESAINEIQGSGSVSPLLGVKVRTTGIVTGIRAFGLGFYIQAPDSEADADANTSEGLLIFRRPGIGVPIVQRGDLVEVTGVVTEFPTANPDSQRVTEISNEPTVRILSTGHPLPTPVTLTVADAPPDGPLDSLEKHEGMRVQVASLHVVAPTQGTVVEATTVATSTGVFFGVIGDTARPLREPGLDPFEPEPPGLPACVPPNPCVPRFDGNPERIRVDSDDQVGTTPLEVVAGETVGGLVGPLNYDFDAYTIAVDPDASLTTSGHPDTSPVAEPRANQFTVASFNLQRLYDTMDDTSTSDVVMTDAALTKRLRKYSALIRTVLRTPDILGVSEAENLEVLEALANQVNADAVAAGQPSPSYVAYLVDGFDPGGIDVGFLVRSTRIVVGDVTQGEAGTFVDPTDGSVDLLNDRPPLILRAAFVGSGASEFPLTVIANHLRSLNDITDPVAGPRVREKRRAQAEFLANLIQARQMADPSERIVVLGDMNAFQFNDGLVDSIGTIKGTPTPADQVLLASPDLVNPDLFDLGEELPDSQRYSFVFAGNAQQLDHMLITQNLRPSVGGIQFARVDADFPESFRNDAETTCAEQPEQNCAERVSDHDPLVAYFTLPGTLSIDDVSVTEGNMGVTQARFTVTLEGTQAQPVSVRFGTAASDPPNGATAGLDFVTNQGTVTFGPRMTTQTVVIDVIGDQLVEPDELFTVRLSEPTANAALSRAIGTGTILNDDVVMLPALTIEDASVDEHDKFARVKVKLPTPSTERVTVKFATADGTATDGVGERKADYVAESGTLVFNPGDVSQTLKIAIVRDHRDESGETFFVNLSEPTNATIDDGQALVSIRDDDRRPRIRIRNAREDEPRSGTALITFHVELSKPSGRTVTASFRTANLSAVAGRDYVAQTGTLTFAPGETRKSITVTILADSKKEFDEAFAVKLSDLVHVEPGDTVGIGTIEKARKRHW